MSVPNDANGGPVARGAGSAALKGALLIGLAILVGIFLLERVDGESGGSAATDTTKPKTTTTTAAPAASTTTTKPPPATPPKSPDQLAVIVLNGGVPAGTAGDIADELSGLGYTNQEPASDWLELNQTGDTVLCKPEFSREAVALTQQPPLAGSTVGEYPNPLPDAVTKPNDCMVVIGA